MDNARIHHYGKLKNFINGSKHTNIIYNIPYSPETNPIEHVFNDIKEKLKKIIINNDNIIDKIKESIMAIKSRNLYSYFNKSLFFY